MTVAANAGAFPNSQPRALTNAAPVGVVISFAGPAEYVGTPLSNSAVAGVGTGNVPWVHSTKPLPVFTGEQYHFSIPSEVSPAAAHTMSVIVSTAPTSWKWTSSTGTPCIFASAWARYSNARRESARVSCDNGACEINSGICFQARP